jgi:hypothetical protein
MFTIFSHEGNANQNYNEILSHLSQNGIMKETWLPSFHGE